jgi:SHS2 domain-containing protein
MTDPQPGAPGQTPELDWLELLDHTADTGIRVRANTLPLLFSRAAWGMFSLIVDPRLVRPLQARPLALEAEDLPGLLVNWLSELNFLHNTQHELYSRFEVTAVDQCRLSAVVGGERIDPNRHTVDTEIKAVTYHELKVERQGECWTAQVIFDL